MRGWRRTTVGSGEGTSRGAGRAAGTIAEAPERRWDRRRRRRARVLLDPGGAAAVTADLSLGGAFVLTAQLREPGTRLRLTFRGARGILQVDGVVRWVRAPRDRLFDAAPVGMGVEFVAFRGGSPNVHRG